MSDVTNYVIHKRATKGPNGPLQATPHEQLLRELHDSSIPKTEREHAAARELAAILKRVEEQETHHT